MSIPVSIGDAEPTPGQVAPRVASPPDPDAAAIIAAVRAALDAPISPRAYRFYVAATTLYGIDGARLSTDQLAAAAGVSNHQARPLVGELVAAGLLERFRTVVHVAGRPMVRRRYRLVVSGTR